VLAHSLIGLAFALALVLPVAKKWQLRLVRVVATVVATALLSAVVAEVMRHIVDLSTAERGAIVAALSVAGAVAFLAYRFVRDPDRLPSPVAGAVVSPADGAVVYVKEARAGVLPVATKRGRDYTLEELTRTHLNFEDAIVVGIGMDLSDVHVNRAPIDGVVTLRRHFPGRFGSLGRRRMEFENERATTVLQGKDFQIAVVQIASRLVRQIVSFVQEGQTVAVGERIGAIRLGSQVDLVLPIRTDLRVLVREGDRVRAGESVVAAPITSVDSE